MQATFFFLARHTSREAPVAGEAQIRAGRGAIARTLALVPRADLGFDRGSYCTGDYQRVDITRGGLKSEVQHLSRIRCCNARQNFVSAAST
jgi:hypothetical protein